MSFPKHLLFVFLLGLLLSGSLWSVTVILNSQDYQDILSAAVYARSSGYDFVFALTPNQSVFIANYYSVAKDNPVIYIEGAHSVLPNMAALLQQSGLTNLTIIMPKTTVQDWVADQLPHNEAIVVGSTYGQDALAVAPYAALTHEPLFFVDDPSNAGPVLSDIASRGYSSVLLYGSIASQIPAPSLSVLPHVRTINTGNAYANNVQIASEYLNITHTSQVMFVSGTTFEKSMVDTQFPLVLVGRSVPSPAVIAFINAAGIKTGVVFAGDADIVDGVSALRAAVPGLALFVKFGEGYTGPAGSAQPLPLVIIPLPAPVISLEVLNLTYNVPDKSFELTVKNHGDFAALSGGISVSGAGSAESSQITLNPNETNTLNIPLDATAQISGGSIASATLTLSYGQDVNLTDNVDTITFTNVPSSFYNDTSDVSLSGISYSDDQKAFLINLDGNGWAEGSLSISINNQPTTLYFPATQVSGPTTIVIKYLLTADQEKFINGLSSNYFIRTGGRSDILIKELGGQSTLSVSGSIFSNPLGSSTGGSGASGLPLLPICALVLLAAVAFLAYQHFSARGGESGGSFD